MADQTVRTIYEADVARAQQSVSRLAGENEKAAKSADRLADALDDAGSKDVKPKIDIAIDQAEKDVKKLRGILDDLSAHPADVAVEADIAKTQAKIDGLTRELQVLEKMEPSPKVTADTAKAEAQLEGLTARLHALEGMNAGATATVDIDQARTKLDQAESRLKALSGAKAEMVVTVDADSVDDAFDGMEDAATEGGEGAGVAAGQALLDGLNSVPVVGTIAGLLAGAGIIGGAALKRGFEVNAARDLFGAKSGLDEATARRYATAAGTAYANAWGESVEANLETARIARENGLLFDDSTDAEIDNVITKLSGVTEILGADVPEAAEAAGTMLRNGLAGDANEAFDIIVAGYQAGLDRSGDFLDTLREYSPMFASLGLDGPQALGLIDQAMQSGARSSDLAADALKEFSIRAQDDSKTTRDAYKSLGLDADKMGADVAAGGDRASSALDTVLDSLRGVTDEQERNRIGTELFGTQWEDLGNGANLLAMDLDSLGTRWTQTGDTADQALARMSDNASSHLESAKRSVEMALTNVAGGLAEAFDAPLSNLSDWVSTHQGDITQWLANIANGIFELAKGAIEWGATMVEVSGHIAGALAGIVNAIGIAVEGFGILVGDDSFAGLGQDIQDASDGMQSFSDAAPIAASRMRDEMVPAIQDVQDGFNDMVDPAILQAQLNDATTLMVGELDSFKAFVEGTGLTLTINGETMDAETALNTLVSEVNASNGTVLINGETVPADQALAVLEQQIDASGGTVTIAANTDPAMAAKNSAVAAVNAASGKITVGANTGPATSAIDQAVGKANSARATITVAANVAAAVNAINSVQGKTVYVDIVSRAIGAASAAARANGGPIARGLAGGGTVGDGYGYVPAPYPGKGIDNVLWPLAHGGQTLSQPLAGGEFVMNPIASAANGALLEYLNAGGKVSGAHMSAPAIGTLEQHFHEVGGEAAEIAAERVLSRVERSLIGGLHR